MEAALFNFVSLSAQSHPYTTDYVGAVGNLVAAVLQTAGLYGQSDVLLFYKEALQSLAGLLYIFAIAGALTSAAVFGNYRNATYFLIGPLLFYGLIVGVTTAKPTSVQVGMRVEKGSEPLQQQLLSAYLEEGSKIYTRELKLSWFFVMFDNLVTNVTQNIVSVLIDEENRADIVKIARERGLVEILGVQNTDRNLAELASVAIAGECSGVMRNYLAAGQPGVRDAKAGTVQAQQRDTFLAEGAKGMQLHNIQLAPTLLKRLGREVTAQRLAAVERFDANAGTTWKNLVSKEVHNCQDIWTMLRVLTHVQAHEKLETIRNRKNEDPTAPEVSWQAVYADIERTFAPNATAEERQAVLLEVFSSNIFKNILAKSNHAQLMNQLNEHGGFNPDGQLFDDVFAGYYSIEGQGALARLTMFTGVIPYLQGLFLFVLSCAFPFFCVFLVIPGRVSSFLTWLWLWVWVKSWDVGFAVIHVLRDILWEWLGKASAPYLIKDVPTSYVPGELPTEMDAFLMRVDYTAIDWNDPSAVFHAVLQGDPMANVSTYYILISLVTLSVPLLTAHLCRGAGQVVGAFQQSFEGIADNFGKTYNNRMEQYSSNAANDQLTQASTAYGLQEMKKYIMQNAADASDAQQMWNAAVNLIKGNGPSSKTAERGDGSLASMAVGVFNRSVAEFNYSNMGTSLNQTRGMYASRQTIWDIGAGQGNLHHADIVDLAIGTMTRDPYLGGKNPGASLLPPVPLIGPGENPNGQGNSMKGSAQGGDSE